MKKAEIISTLMDFQNLLLLDIPNWHLMIKDEDRLYRAIWAGINAIIDSPNDELDDDKN